MIPAASPATAATPLQRAPAAPPAPAAAPAAAAPRGTAAAKLPFAKTEPIAARTRSDRPPAPPVMPAAPGPDPELDRLKWSTGPAAAPEPRVPRSTRPSAAWDLAAAPEQASLAETFASLLNDVEQSFGSLQMKKGDSQRPDTKAGELTGVGLDGVRELFAELATNHMRPVRDFMIDVKWGEASRDWASVCEPAIRSLERAAERLELGELCQGLGAYREALEAAAAATDPTVTGAAKERLLAAYARLTALMPQAFGLDSDRSQREAVIVQSLLLQVPDVRKVTIDKLYGAGLTSLDVIFAARADDIAATTGIPQSLAERIVHKVQQYRRELSTIVPDASRSAERAQVTTLANELRRQHTEFEQAAAGWSEDATAKKRYLRQARDETLLRIKVLLARLGEVQRLTAIERLPYQKKLEMIESFLEERAEGDVPG